MLCQIEMNEQITQDTTHVQALISLCFGRHASKITQSKTSPIWEEFIWLDLMAEQYFICKVLQPSYKIFVTHENLVENI